MLRLKLPVRLLFATLFSLLLSVSLSLTFAFAQGPADTDPFAEGLRLPVNHAADGADAFVPGVVLVQMNPGVGDARWAYGITTALAEEVHAVAPLTELKDTYQLLVEPGHELAVVAQLAKNPHVLTAEPDFLFYKTAITPDDTLYTRYQWNLRHIGANMGWQQTTGSSNVIIAVVDTGVDLTHPDLADKIVPGYDIHNDDADPSDDEGHGTHVASIAAASSNNGQGIAGLSWGARIMPVKVLDANGSGKSSNVASGIIWAVDNGAQVINLSLGSSNYSTAVQNAVTYAHSRGVLVVAAAGNHYKKGNPTTYPAAYTNVLAVAATNDSDGHASYSSSGSYVDVAAPGGDPAGSNDGNHRNWIPGAYWRGSGISYAWLSGTSQAAPHVAGLAALLLALDPNLTPDQLHQIIISTAVDVQDPGWDEFSGHGRIDVAAALAAVPSLAAAPQPTPTPPPTSMQESYRLHLPQIHR
jgi:subtilisin family serine protease